MKEPICRIEMGTAPDEEKLSRLISLALCRLHMAEAVSSAEKKKEERVEKAAVDKERKEKSKNDGNHQNDNGGSCQTG